MVKTLQQLKQLQSNPYYTMSPEEKQQLLEAEVFDSSDEGKKKELSLLNGTAHVREKGQLDTHSTDIV